MNRLKNSEASRSAKSIGDSIKKHIFHKSIISRTPKRTAHNMQPIGTGMEVSFYMFSFVTYKSYANFICNTANSN